MALNSNFRTLTADNIEGIVEDRNYLKSSFENGQLTGWTEVSVALTSGLPTGTPTIGATAAASLALSATSVTPLSGSRSLLVDVPSALTAGHGFISDEFTLDRMDLGKVLTVSFDYERLTGNYNFSGTLGSQTWMVYIYDATAGGANWIQPAGFLGMNQSSGPGRIRATFQSSVVAGQKYRVAVIASQAAAGASSISFDNFTCSRQTAPIGPVVTDWVSYTPTGTWVSGATYTGKYRRVGDSIQCSVKIAITGPVTATDLQVSIPSGFSIDTAKMASGDFLQSVFGTAHAYDASTLAHYNFQIGYASPTLLFFTVQNQLTGQVISVTNTAPQTWANGDAIHATFMVPVVGASSNVQLSNDTDTRVVAFKGLNIVASIAAGSQDIPKIIIPGVARDTHGTYNTSTGAYTIPVSGFYRIIHRNLLAIPNGNDFRIGYAVNTTTGFHRASFLRNTSGLTLDINPVCSGVEYLNAGETVYFCCAHSSGSAINLTNDGRFQEYSIERLSGPSVVAASETVAMRAQNTAGTSIPTGGGSTVPFATKIYDSHNAWNGSLFTAPISGKYQVNCHIYFGGGQVWSANVVRSIQLVKSGAAFVEYICLYVNPSAYTGALGLVGSSTIDVNAGETLSINIQHNEGTARLLDGTQLSNVLTINRVGN